MAIDDSDARWLHGLEKWLDSRLLIALASSFAMAACSGEDTTSDAASTAPDDGVMDGASGQGSSSPNSGAKGTGGSKAACGGDAECEAECDNGQCPSAPSCAKKHGGRTCGPNGDEDCCVEAQQASLTIDKYLITAGRMRTFIEHFEGNIRGFVATLPAGEWNDAWNYGLPTDLASANTLMGGYANKRSCVPGDSTGRTYWTPKTNDDYSDFSQDVLDEKALNCVPWPMLKALCAWDGKHLALAEELRAAFTNGGRTSYPWGDGSYNPSQPDERLNAQYNHTTPLPAEHRTLSSGAPADAAFFVSPPGRYPKGNNAVGIADMAGNLLEFTGDEDRRFVWKGSWEQHGAYAANLLNVLSGRSIWSDGNRRPWIWGNGDGGGTFGNSQEKNGYYAIGGRCAR